MLIAPPFEIGPLDPAAQRAVRELAAAAEQHDGVAPLSEQFLLNLSVDDEWVTHVVAHDKLGATIGYAQIDRSGDVASAELVVRPERRRNGTGRLLLRIAERDATLPARSGEPGQHGKTLHVWAHGDLPEARGLAEKAGYRPARELLFLARPLDKDLPAPRPVPVGLRLRTFVPGHDDGAWLGLNARAFASHPEQGRLSPADLAARQAEPWFDPDGFFLVESADSGEPALRAFLWTKVEQPGPDGTRDGEIYVVGVAPESQSLGLGSLLTSVALAHLAEVGCTRAVLYVEGDNTPALATYEKAGFTRAGSHVQYTRA
ncbi:mycothiol synthase [Antribacter gilvus]|uniref:mycothiol synthase n=1 Tax=Antribacter gilvus TaxID=2304675 RepID=UPI000F795DCD|nr:mycothiol synthase [Antribacter gilvus]